MNDQEACPLTYTESSWALLAGTRFVLAAVVFLHHLKWFMPPPLVWEVMDGKAAVVGFLLISGLSIGHSYRQRPEGYYARRFLRIYPLYFFAVALAVLLVCTVGPRYEVGNSVFAAAGWKTALGNFLLLQDFVVVPYPFNLAVWTLSVEVFFYLLTPLLARTRPAFLWLAVMVSMMFYLKTDPLWICGMLPAAFGWAWLIGFIVAYRGWSVATALTVIVGAFIPLFHYSYLRGEWVWLPIVGTAALLWAAPWVRLSRGVRKVLNYLGELSYPLYLFHIPLSMIFYHFTALRNYPGLVSSVLIGSAVLNLVFDHWLKAVFWRPLVERISGLRRAKTVSAVPTVA